MGKKHFCFFQTAEPGNQTPNSGVKGSGANHYHRAPALELLENDGWGPIKESRPNDSLTEHDFTTNDPYSPKVDFPSGRKRTRTATRGVSMSKLKGHAINVLNTKLNNDDNLEPKKKRRRLGKRAVVNKDNILDNFKPTLICSACITEGNSTPFIANYQKYIDAHLKAVHTTIVCGLCFQEKNTINKFVTEKELKHHQINNQKPTENYP